MPRVSLEQVISDPLLETLLLNMSTRDYYAMTTPITREQQYATSLLDLWKRDWVTPQDLSHWFGLIVLSFEQAEFHPSVFAEPRATLTVHDTTLGLIFDWPPNYDLMDNQVTRPHVYHAINQSETIGPHLFRLATNRARISGLPKTQPIIDTLRRLMAATGWPILEGPLRDLDAITPVDPDQLTVSPNHLRLTSFAHALAMPAHNHPKQLGNLGEALLTIGDEVKASDVPGYVLRELERLRNHEYIPLPDNIIEQIDELTYLLETPHLAVKGPNRGKVAYTENKRKGIHDVQSVMKPGKYLRRVLKDQVSDQRLKELVAEMISSADFEVHHTRCPEKARWVYLNGPSSCMSHDEERFDQTFDRDDNWYHPIEALFNEDESGDIELIWVELQGRPAARALANAESKRYPSLYAADWAPGARQVMEEYLRENNYRGDSNALEGIVIRAIELRNGCYLCPYIDHDNQGVDWHDEPDTFIIGGQYKANYDEGYVDPEGIHTSTCDDCDECISVDELHYVYSCDREVCESCLNAYYVHAYCPNGHVELVHEDDAIHLGFVHRYNFDYFESIHRNADLAEVGLCEVNGDIYDRDDCRINESNGDWVLDGDVQGQNSPPSLSHGTEDYIETEDSEVYDEDECIWLDDREVWIHEDDLEEENYFVETTRFGNRIATLIEDQDEDAA